jgi:DNA repair exonuclease SbcCD ATPase subunit
LSKWVETQQILSKEKNEWQEARDILQARIELMKSEIASLEQKIKEAETGAREAEQKKAELVAQDAALKVAAAALREAAADLEAKVRQLYQIVPEPLQAKINPLYQRMPDDPMNTKVTLAERFQNILGILNEVNKLNGEITLATEVRALADGKPAEVKTVYVGLAQAYYVSPQGEAGIGRPGQAGWQWEPSNGLAAEVAETISIMQGKGTPRFIPLPVTIQ